MKSLVFIIDERGQITGCKMRTDVYTGGSVFAIRVSFSIDFGHEIKPVALWQCLGMVYNQENESDSVEKSRRHILYLK